MGRYDVLLGKENPSTKVESEQAPKRTGDKLVVAKTPRQSTSDDVPQIVREPIRTQTANPVVLPVRDVRPVLPVPPLPGIKRVMKQRHPFDIYRDQYDSLQQLALEDRMNGGVGSMSAMVREALDTYIESHKKKTP